MERRKEAGSSVRRWRRLSTGRRGGDGEKWKETFRKMGYG